MKENKKVFLRVVAMAAVFCLLIACFPTALFIADAVIPPQYSATYYAQFGDMYSKMKNAEGKKVVIIGGSSVAFGVESAMAENELRHNGYDYTVCNFGLYGALGTKVMLDLSAACVSEGDVMVLAIEPEAQLNSLFFGAEYVWKCIEEDRGIFFDVAGSDRSSLAGAYMQFVQERYGRYSSGEELSASPPYSKSAFDDNGDMSYFRAGNNMALGYDPSDAIELNGGYMSADFIDYVNEYIAEVEKKGGTVCMSFAPMNKAAITDLSDEAVYGWFTFLNSSFNCPVISDPWDYILESGWFYDNNYHLNSAGAVIRTLALTRDILRYMGCDAAVDWEVPEMPESIYKAPSAGGSQEDAACFEYGEVKDASGEVVGVAITALSEQGRAKSSLVIPSEYGGLPVISFGADVFSGNSVLEELVIPASVASLEDYSFDGCEELSTIRLLHTSSPPSVGAHPFDDSDGEVVDGLELYVEDEDIYVSAGCIDLWAKYIPYMRET